MVEYCEECGEELDSDEEYEGICKNCKRSRSDEYKSDEEFVDPGVT